MYRPLLGPHLDADRALLGRGRDAALKVRLTGPAPAERGLDDALSKMGLANDELARETERIRNCRSTTSRRRRKESLDEPAMGRSQGKVALKARC